MEPLTDAAQCPQCGGILCEGWCLPCVARLSSGPSGASSRRTASGTDAEMTGAAALPPPEVPGLAVNELLAVGGMSQVWLARGKEQGECLAVKVVHERFRGRSDIQERFEQEAEVLMALHHPNILSLCDVGETVDGRLYLTMPYVDGCDLRRLLKAGKLPLDRAVTIFLAVCQALEYAHGQRVIHRDVKPANILVGADGTVKLADFGLAKFHGEGQLPLTRPQEAFGTAYYIAPECLLDTSAADERSDVFALGVLLYELTTGTVPQGHFSSLALKAGLARGWDSTVQAALKDDPTQRLQSVAELRKSVEKLWHAESHRGLKKRWQSIAAVSVGLAGALGLGLFLGTKKAASPPDRVHFPSPTSATKEKPWKNSFGVEMVPVPGHQSLIGIRELPAADFAQYLTERDRMSPPWLITVAADAPASLDRLQTLGPGGWQLSNTGLKTEISEHEAGIPASGVSLIEGYRFCTWLTWKERQEGRIAPHHHYRPPTNEEWIAVDGYAANQPGNFAGSEANDQQWPPDRATHPGTDPFARISPSASFPPNAHGLYDVSGNLSEWVIRQAVITRHHLLSPKNFAAVVGGSWADLPEVATHRNRSLSPLIRSAREDVGFRLVLDLQLSSLIDPEMDQHPPQVLKRPRPR